jgi:hypothetical protein
LRQTSADAGAKAIIFPPRRNHGLDALNVDAA